MTWLSRWFRRQPTSTEDPVSWALLRTLRSRDSTVQCAVIMAVAGHRPTGLADALGGYLCACRAASWSNLDEYGPYGGCPAGWYDAREFLARYGVPAPINFEAARRHHEFGHRNGLTAYDHDDPLCRKYGCPDDSEWKGDRR